MTKTIATKNKTKQYENYDLFAMTRTDDIPNHWEQEHNKNTKEIATTIRKHIRARFPMCKWSVRSDSTAIDVNLMESPFAKDSDEVKAIAEYAHKFTQSFNYDNSDSMTDYFEVNFYGTCSIYSRQSMLLRR